MMIKHTSVLSILAAGLLFFSACVPVSKFNAAQSALSSARYDSSQLANKVKDLQSSLAQANQLAANQKQQIDSLSQQMNNQQQQIATLTQQVAEMKQKNNDLTTDAANRQALLSKSKQDLIAQQVKLEHLQELMDRQKKAIEEIRKKMTDALVGFKSSELS
ncbi:MAG TPA: flagellar motor protein MotB, partial [Puia sp.]|nr:flagellar motor protein MotB [Puia sp.]